MLKVAKSTGSLLRKANPAPKNLAFVKKQIALIEGLNSQAWTQAWSLPPVTRSCLSFSSTQCSKVSLTPLVDLYNQNVANMNSETLKLNRLLKKFNKAKAAKLSSALRKNLEESLTTSETLKVDTLECK
jgi:hypothetical protein